MNYEHCCEEKHVGILFRGEVEKKHVLIKDFNTFMYDHSLHPGRKHFCHYCLHAFTTEGILKCYIKDCFQIKGRQLINMPKKSEYVKFKNFEIKIKSPFMIHVDLESILVPEGNGKQNPKSMQTNIKTCCL